jgi:hypothetical protein
VKECKQPVPSLGNHTPGRPDEANRERPFAGSDGAVWRKEGERDARQGSQSSQSNQQGNARAA